MNRHCAAQPPKKGSGLRFWRSLAAVTIALLFYGATQSPSQSFTPDSAPPQLVIQTGHSSRINCAVFGPDHRWLASGGADNTIRLWDVDSGHELRALIGHKNWIKSLAVSRNGELLASGSNDRTVKVWNVSSGRELLSLAGHEGPVEVVSFSPDDRWIISGSTDSTIKVWDAVSGRLLQTLKPHLAGVTALAISADGKLLASAAADNSIKLWDTATWRELRTLNKQIRKITTLAFSHDGRHLVSGSIDGSLILWDTTNGRDRMLPKPVAVPVLASAFIAGDEFLSVSADGTVASWDAATGKQKRVVAGDQGVEEILFAALSHDGAVIAESAGNRVVEVHSALDGKLVRALASHSASFFSVAFSHDGRWLAAGTNDRTIRLWQVATGREMPKLSGHTGWVKAVAFSPDSRWLASASNSGEVKLWETNTGHEIYSEPYSQERLHTIAFSPDGKLVAAAGTGQTVHLLDVATKRTRNLTGHTGEVTSLAFVPNSSLIASGSTDKTVRLSNLATGTVVRTFELSGQVNAVAVSPDGTMLAAGTADNKVALLTVASGAVRTMTASAGEVFSLAFSPDGSWLASGGMDQTVRLWDAQTGLEVRALAGSSGDVNGVVFSNDSRSLISANGDGSMIVWRADSGTLAGIMVSIPESNDWLVATPAGLFDGSHSAWKLLLWRFGQSTFKVAPVESFFNEFYYPGLLADILANKNPSVKQDISKRDRRQPQIHLETVDAPAGNAARRMVRLRLETTEAPPESDHRNGSGVRDLRLFRNGLLVQAWGGDILQGASKRTIETSVPIVAGKNEFTAYAFNRDNVKSTDSLLLINGGEELRREGTAYVVVVGVSKYANSQYNLNYSVADANEIGTQLKSQQEVLGRYRPIEVVSLLNEDATKENILLALKLLAGTARTPIAKNAPADLLKIKPAQPEDAVIFYFSGHGTAKDDRFYLIPHDLGYQGLRSELDEAGLATILAHSVSDLELEEALKPVDVDQLLLVIDACNSGQALQAADERRGPMNARGLAQLAYEKGMYVLTASQSDEVAFESAGLKHSYLAYALVEEGIISGAADADHNGQVFLNEWFNYATERVPRIGSEKRQTGKQLEEVDADEKRVQRPRVFNMREGGAERFAIARLTRDGRSQ